jgi:hypothetical protein
MTSESSTVNKFDDTSFRTIRKAPFHPRLSQELISSEAQLKRLLIQGDQLLYNMNEHP